MKIVSTSLAALVATLLTSTASMSANSTTSITNTIVTTIEASGQIVLAQAETEAEKKAKMMAKEAEMMAAEEDKKKAMMMAAEACDAVEYSVTGFKNAGAGAGSVADIASKINALSGESACLIEITGYSSTSGPKSVNAALSEERAEWVKSQLMAAGVDVSQTSVTGAGETRQFGKSSANRRVVISIK